MLDKYACTCPANSITFGWVSYWTCIGFKLVGCVMLNVPLENPSLIWRRHHYLWKCRSMVGTYDLWSESDFLVLQLLWHGVSDFALSSERPPHLVASYDKGYWNFSNPDPHGVNMYRYSIPKRHITSLYHNNCKGLKLKAIFFSTSKYTVLLPLSFEGILRVYVGEVLKTNPNTDPTLAWYVLNYFLLCSL